MNTSRRLVFWLILIISLIISVWWIFYVPYRPDRVFGAIPATATVVSVNENLAGEWDAVFTNPLLLRAVKAAEVEESAITKLKSNKVVRKWTEKLAADRTIIAYVAALGPEQKPALVAASWIGNQSRLLRWQMAWIKTRDLIPVNLDGGNLKIWLSNTKFGKTDLRLSLALSEGLVLACISEDPIGVRTLLEAAEAYPFRHTLAERDRPALARGLLKGHPRHWGWLEAKNKPVAFEFELKPKSLCLNLSGLESLPVSAPLKDAAGSETAMNFIGNTSDLAALLPLSWVNEFLPRDPSLLLIKTVQEFANSTDAPTNALAFVALLDQDHYGRVRGPMNKTMKALMSKGVKVPTLLAGLQVKSDAEADKRINQMLAKLNSQYGLELVAGPFEPESGLRMTSIQDARKSFYGSFELQERVAYAARGNWLILASNGSILKKILSQPPREGKSEWTLDATEMPAATAWANLNGIAQTLKNAVAIAKLGTMLDSSEKSQSRRTILDQAGLATAVLRELDQANLTVQSAPTGFQVKLVIGPRQ